MDPTMQSTKWFYRVIPRTVAVIAASLTIGIIPAQSQNFETTKIFVCTNKIKTKADACAEAVPPFDNLDRRVFPNKRIDFKLTILGQREALAYLQNHGYLPVKVGVWRDGIRKDDDISIDINQNDWATNGDELSGQFSEDGQFRWRTFFYVNVNNAKTIGIEINDAQENTVSSDGHPARLSLAFSN